MKKSILLLAKLGVTTAIISYLVLQAQRHQSFAALCDQPKHWTLLVVAWGIAMIAVSLTFVRWFILVRAVKLPFAVRDAFRLGFLGYLLNFVSVGSAGGDLFKAVFLAREQGGRRVEAVASIIVDRAIGVFALLLLAASAILVLGLDHGADTAQIAFLCRATLATAVLATAGACVFVVRAATSRARESQAYGEVPVDGGTLQRFFDAMGMYRENLWVLLLACLLSIGTHVLSALSVFTVACGLSSEHPSLADHFVIVPLGIASGTLPLPLGALGALEYVIDYLYRVVFASDQGLVVALGYRLLTVIIAMVGACFYFASRRREASALDDAAAGTHESDQDALLSKQLGRAHLGKISDRHVANYDPL